jgi:hypothetical protein
MRLVYASRYFGLGRGCEVGLGTKPFAGLARLAILLTFAAEMTVPTSPFCVIALAVSVTGGAIVSRGHHHHHLWEAGLCAGC